MNRNIILSLLTILLLSACGEEKDVFVIKGKINNLGGRPLYAVYEKNNGIAIDTLLPEDGRIEMRGKTLQITPIQLYDYTWQPYMRLYMTNGERVEIEGDAKAKYEIEMKGNRLNRDFWKLICQNNEIFDAVQKSGVNFERGIEKEAAHQAHLSRLDSLLIDYVDNHHGNLLSSILIGDYLLRYENFALCDSLWSELNDDAKVPYIGATMERLRNEMAFDNDNNKLPHLRYLNDNDSLIFINTRHSKATLLCIWQATDKQAHSWREELGKYARRYDKKSLQTVALAFDCDTAVWHRAIEKKSDNTIDIWGNDVYTGRQLKNFHIKRMPVYLLADSLGNILVRTSRLPDADIDRQIDSLITRHQYKIEQPIFKP